MLANSGNWIDIVLPLVVDLDGTLVRSDLLIESGLLFLRKRPAAAALPLVWLLKGKAYLKQRLATAVSIDVATLPYDDDVLGFIRQERALGRPIVLATASHRVHAERVAAHLQLFDRVIATDGATNLSASAKRDELVRLFGDRGFDYLGNSRDDLQVWSAARRAYIANPEAGVEAGARALGNVERVVSRGRVSAGEWVRALRLHQWTKNLLLFVPLLASHKVGRADLILDGALAFVLFGLCASSVYLLNDLLDLQDDRHHVGKRGRAFARGAIPLKSGLVAFPLLLAGAFAGAVALMPIGFVQALATYYLVTVLYSMLLKGFMALDVVTLAILYTIRIIAGTFVFGVTSTFWMLAFSMFIFLSLALVKRYSELDAARRVGRLEKSRGRGYFPGDLEMIASLGGAAGYMSVLVLALYIQDLSTVALYRYPKAIWLACPILLFWISRVWLLTHRGQMHDDPVVFALKDRTSLVVGAMFGTIFWFAA
jgi:4-hydroxybenzoate polyprenyltransferase/phosphoserine phosphatase